MRLNRAIDIFEDALALETASEKTRRTYVRHANLLADVCDPEIEVAAVTEDHIRRHLGRWRNSSPQTKRLGIFAMRSFFRVMVKRGCVLEDPTTGITLPRRPRPWDTPALGGSNSSSDVAKIIAACEPVPELLPEPVAYFQELLCVGAAAYSGRRRAALSRARRYDADLDAGYIRFTDKRQKLIEQPIPDDFLAVLRAADAAGVWPSADAYLIPNRRPGTVGANGRGDKVIYETVVKVARRVGLKTAPHALRAAFATEFLESNPGQLETAKELLGHDDVGTTMVYLRRLNRQRAMERVRTLSFAPHPGSSRELENGSQTAWLSEKAHTGFEPVLQAQAEAAPQPLTERLAELRATSAQIKSKRRRKARARR